VGETKLYLPLMLALLGLLLLDALVTRAGWKLPEFGRLALVNRGGERGKKAAAVQVPAGGKAKVGEVKKKAKEAKEEVAPVSQPSDRRSRYARAKRGK